MGSTQTKQLNLIRNKKILQRNQVIKSQLGMIQNILKSQNLTDQFIQKITRLSLQELINELNNHKVTSKQLIAIYGYRSATIGLKLGLITQTNFQDALKIAQKCDQIRRSTKKSNWTFRNIGQKQEQFLPALFGVPVSIKDTFDMKGLSSTVGMTHRAFDLKNDDGFLIKAIKEAGLIPFIKSNVPQLAMIFDSYNYLWGRGKNPWNQQRGIGGSSGGQGGLIASRCSPIGIGSDIGGSIRIPAQFCGVFGLKSSDSRLSNNYSTEYCRSFAGMDTLKVVTGPLSNSVEALAYWLKTVSEQNFYNGNHDVYNKLIPFNNNTYELYQNKKKLKIGYIKSLDLIESTKASQRAIQQTINLVQSLGHQAIPVKIPNEKYIIRSFFSQFAAQGNCQSFKLMLKGEPLIPQYNQVNMLAGLNSWIFYVINALYNKTAPRLGFLLQGSNKKTVHQYLVHVGQVQQYRKQFVQYWKNQKLDFIILPGFGSQACLHGYSQKANLAAAYTFIWNVLGMTVGSMPITISRKEQEDYESKYQDEVTTQLKKTAKNSQGLPVGIQIVGLPFEDQKVLGFMKTLQSKIQFYKKFPLPKCQ